MAGRRFPSVAAVWISTAFLFRVAPVLAEPYFNTDQVLVQAGTDATWEVLGNTGSSSITLNSRSGDTLTYVRLLAQGRFCFSRRLR
jgi:hypothetical protein